MNRYIICIEYIVHLIRKLIQFIFYIAVRYFLSRIPHFLSLDSMKFLVIILLCIVCTVYSQVLSDKCLEEVDDFNEKLIPRLQKFMQNTECYIVPELNGAHLRDNQRKEAIKRFGDVAAYCAKCGEAAQAVFEGLVMPACVGNAMPDTREAGICSPGGDQPSGLNGSIKCMAPNALLLTIVGVLLMMMK
jgi:hypothetical protein